MTHRERKNIVRKQTRNVFNTLISDAMLTEQEEQLLRMHYLEGKLLSYCGDMLGYTESAIKQVHRRALEKIEHFLV